MSCKQRRFNLIMRFWPLGKVINWLGTRPGLKRVMQPCFNPEESEAIFIPVNEAIAGTESVSLPYQILSPIIERASRLTILSSGKLELHRRSGLTVCAIPSIFRLIGMAPCLLPTSARPRWRKSTLA